jgi:hypothetical protein
LRLLQISFPTARYPGPGAAGPVPEPGAAEPALIAAAPAGVVALAPPASGPAPGKQLRGRSSSHDHQQNFPAI